VTKLNASRTFDYLGQNLGQRLLFFCMRVIKYSTIEALCDSRRDREVAPKCEAFHEARRDRVPAAAGKAKPHGRGFALKSE
jgi:hypothetical protein